MERKRFIEYDLMRILACFGVIMIHVAVFGQADIYAYNTWEFQWINIWGVLSRWAVPAFVMLSGMMILPKANEESIVRLMIRRVIRMLVVYVVWSAVYSAYNVYVLNNVYAPTKFKTFADGCFSGELHMWYVPMIAGLYLVSPILGFLVKNLNRKWTMYWLAGMFVFSSLIPFLEKLNIEFVSAVISSINGYADVQFLSGWTLYYVLGYYIQQHKFTKKEKIIVYAAAVLALIYTFERTILYGMMYGEAYGVLNYEYPNIYLIGIGVIVFFKEEVSRIHCSVRMGKCIEIVSALTFGIYLSHVLVLRILYAVGVNLQIMHTSLSIPLVALVVFVLCAVVTWLVRRIPIIGKYIV